MWKDLTDHWDILEPSPIVRHLTHSAGESFRDSRRPDGSDIESVPVHELDVAVPIPADGSQLRAVALAADGHTFVLEGPPGTGKSQTITNLIAHTLAQGRTVLFVAEKQAALDVVKKRLDKVGLTKFTLDLHGKNQSANAIRDQLKRAIEHSTSYNNRSWAAKRADVRSHHVPLEDYPTKIHETNGVDHSLWSAYDTILGLGDGPSATIPATFVANPSVSVPEITSALQQFERAARSISISAENPWSIAGIIDAHATDDDFLSVAARSAASLDAVHRSSTVHYAVEQVPSPETLELLLPQARRQIGRPIPPADASDSCSSVETLRRGRRELRQFATLTVGRGVGKGVRDQSSKNSGRHSDLQRCFSHGPGSGLGLLGVQHLARTWMSRYSGTPASSSDLHTANGGTPGSSPFVWRV